MKVLIDLVATGNIERAGKLCRAAPTSLVPQLIHPLLVLAGTSRLGDPLAELSFVARGALERAEAQVRRWIRVGLVAGLAVVGATLYGVLHWSREDTPAWVILGLALLVLVHAARRLQLLLDALRSAPVEVIAALLLHRQEHPVPPEDIAAAIVAAPRG